MFIQIRFHYGFALLQLQLTQLLAPPGEWINPLPVGQSPFLFLTRRFWNLLITIFVRFSIIFKGVRKWLTIFSLAFPKASSALQFQCDGVVLNIDLRRIHVPVPRAAYLRKLFWFFCSMNLNHTEWGLETACLILENLDALADHSNHKVCTRLF